MTNQDRNLSGMKHQVEGKAREAQGAAERKAGDITDDRSRQAKGMAHEAAGKAESELGKAERKLS